jgi:hypothetical protein
MSHSFLRAVSFVALAGLSLATASASSSEPVAPKDLGGYTCKEIMRLSGEDRDIAVALAHGYVMGKKNTTLFETDAMARTTDNFINDCLDHPTENALAVFERSSKSTQETK